MSSMPAPGDLAPQSLSQARALPAHWYCDPATVALERHAIFDRGWHLLAHASRLRASGSKASVPIENSARPTR